MRIVYCGSGAFGVPSLEAMLRRGHDVSLIVTQPPRQAGRGGHGTLRSTPLAMAAGGAGIKTLACPKINAPDIVAAIAAERPDVIVVADFGQMIRADVRDLAPLGAFNLHGSVLPELRGAAPINWAIMRGCPTSGVTTFKLVDKMDAGEVYLTASTPISPDETADELKARLSVIGADLVCRTLDMLASGHTQGVVQDESKVTLAPRVSKTDGVIDWSASATSVRNLVHGAWSWPGGQTIFRRSDGHETVVEIARAAVDDSPAAGAPGVIDADLRVATGAGRLEIKQLQPAGKRLMNWRDFVNGYRVRAGDCFVKPATQTAGPTA